jgi:hypothetical protein
MTAKNTTDPRVLDALARSAVLRIATIQIPSRSGVQLLAGGVWVRRGLSIIGVTAARAAIMNERNRIPMKQLRSFGAIVLAALLLVVANMLIVPMSVSASSDTPPTVPGAIAVPDGSVLLFSRQAKGVQIYDCKNGQWVFHAPQALLIDPQSKQPTGIHYGGIDRGLTPGPWWESIEDGSRIRGGNALSAPSPNPNSIPLLRLEVLEREGSGVFSPVSYIQRLNTKGGTSPTSQCQSGTQRWVPYTADYYFYTAP